MVPIKTFIVQPNRDIRHGFIDIVRRYAAVVVFRVIGRRARRNRANRRVIVALRLILEQAALHHFQ